MAMFPRVVPSILIEAPGIGSPLSVSITLPDIFPVTPAKSGQLEKIKIASPMIAIASFFLNTCCMVTTPFSLF